MRARVHKPTFTTQDGSRLTCVEVGHGVITVATRQDYRPGDSLDVEPEGSRWRAIEREGAE